MGRSEGSWAVGGIPLVPTEAKGRRRGNSLLALLLMVSMLVSVGSTLVLFQVTAPPTQEPAVTGYTSSASVSFCVNTQPSINVSSCPTQINVSQSYTCQVNATDINPGTSFTFVDNSSLFAVGSVSGVISFTPGAGDVGIHGIGITADDGSGCSNAQVTGSFTLNVSLSCEENEKPVFSGLASSYSVDRNASLFIDINATDAENDSVNFTLAYLGYEAYATLDDSSSVVLDTLTGELNITPGIEHVGYHLLNITIEDNATCLDRKTSQVINLSVIGVNTEPEYIGQTGDLNYTWNEDTSVLNAYDLDDYFNDSDGDCLKYEVRNLSTSPFIAVVIDNNRDPRNGSCPTSHFATLIPQANQFGKQLVGFRANDTLNASEEIIAVYTVNNVPEASEPPPQPSAGGGGGGGGGGGALRNLRCEEKWFCGGWGVCEQGYVARNCTDVNSCGTGRFSPNVTKECSYVDHCYNDRQDGNEEGVDCGGSCPNACATCFDAIMNCPRLANGTEVCEEGVDCGGPCRTCTEEEIIATGEDIPRLSPPALFGPTEYAIISALGLLGLLGAFFWWRWKKRKVKETRKAKKEKRKSLGQVLRGMLSAMLSFFRKRKVEEPYPERAGVRHQAPKTRARKLEQEPEPGKPRRIASLFGRLRGRLKRMLGREEEEGTGVRAPLEVPDIEARLEQLSAKVGKEDSTHLSRELGSVLKDWLRHRFSLDYEATYEELGKEALEQKEHEFMRRKVDPFLEKLVEVEYGGVDLSPEEMRGLIREARGIIGIRKPVKKAASRQRKRARHAAVLAIILFLGIGGLLLMQDTGIIGVSDITGFLVQRQAEFISPLQASFQQDGLISIYEGEKRVQGITLTGTMSRDAEVEIYAGSLLVLSSADIMPDLEPIQTDVEKEFLPGEKGIDLRLRYASGTRWDADDDGVVEEGDAVDLIVRDSVFSWEADADKLCTLWTVEGQEKTTAACYGSQDCCSLVELVPEREGWDDAFFLTQADAGSDAVVRARMMYADYSLEARDAFSEIVQSETESISAYFLPERISFENACAATCSLDEFLSGTLEVRVRKGDVFLDRASYTSGLSFNRAPVFTLLPDMEIPYGGSSALRLADFASDPDGDSLQFSAHPTEGVTITLEGNIATLLPEEGFTGETYVFFSANDSEQAAVSRLITLTILPPENRTQQGKVRVGEPVRWVKRVPNTGKVELEHEPLNVSVKEVTENGLTRLGAGEITVRDPGPRRLGAGLEGGEGGAGGGSGAGRPPAVKEVVVNSAAEELEVEYYTEAPTASERRISAGKKEVTISAEIHYTDIIAFTELEDVPESAINLYHLVNGTRVRTPFDSQDRNGNSLVDYIEWTVPHLSNQTYEVDITILNVQSYPTVGGDWEVRFTTVGTANLTIEASNGTTYGSSTPDDLTPKELRCGDEVIEYSWSGDTVEALDYACNETGYWTVEVLTAGKHTQHFLFGDEEGYANNFASVNSSGTNLSIWDEQDVDGLARYATDNLTFYANYTNGSIPDIISGVCTISFNLTGSFEGEANMTYNGAGEPYNYSRSILYKGRSYFNVICVNSTYSTLNVTDDILINNSAPVFNNTDGKLPALSCTEDIPCSYNTSQYASDPDLNDVQSFDYAAGSIQNLTSHQDCSGCWSFNFGTGNFTVSVTTSQHAQAGPFRPIVTVSDTDDDSDSATIEITVTAVNDIPLITQPAGNTLTSAVTESFYSYTIQATDEEDGTNLTYNFSIVSCQQNYLADCSALTMPINTTTGEINFTPVNNDAGNYTLNITAEDTMGARGYRLANLTITDINNAPVFDVVCDDNRTAVEDVLHSCVVNATDPELDVLNFTANVSWFTFDFLADNAVLANFTPTNAEVGNHSILLNVSDGFLSDTRVINFTVNNTNDAPVLEEVAYQTAIISRNYTLIITAADDDFSQPDNTFHNDSENLTFTVNQSFFTLTKLNATAATLNFTPTDSQGGNYTVLLNVSDSAGAYNITLFNLTVRNNTAPAFDQVCDGQTLVQEAVAFGCHVNATDNESDSFTFAVNVSWLSVNASGNVTAFVNDSLVGNHTVRFNVTDAWGDFSEREVNFTVNNTPEAPYFLVVPNLTASEGILFTYNLSGNVTDEDQNTPEGDTLTFTDNSTFFNVSVSGLINFTPQLADVGNHSVNITVTDSFGLSVSEVLAFEVENVNDAPVFDEVCGGSRIAQEDEEFTCVINATDADLDNLTFAINLSFLTFNRTSPTSVLVNFTPDNSLVGNYSVNISVSDGQLDNHTLINLTVNNTNDAPVLTIPAQLNATEDSLFNYTLNATDDDLIHGDVLVYTSNSTLFTVNLSTGLILFTPNVSQVGNHSIVFNVTDDAGALASEQVLFSVLDFNDFPILESIPNFIIDEATAFLYDINASDEEDSESLLRFRVNTTLFTVNDSTGVISFTPNSSHVGFHAFNATVNDTAGQEASQLFNMTIRTQNFIPNITLVRPYGTPLSSVTVLASANRSDFPLNLTSINLTENSSVLFNISVTDPNGDSLNISWYRDGVLNITSNETAFTYSLGFLENGTRNITVSVADGREQNVTFTWNVSVADVNRPPLFGTIEHDAGDFASGTDNLTNTTDTGILLAVNGSGYSNYGEFTSGAVNLGPGISAVYNPIGFQNLSWDTSSPAGTAILFQTRTSEDGSTWGNWSANLTNASQIRSENKTYIQYRAILTGDGSSTPNLTRVQISHLIPGITLDAGDTLPSWIDLDHYFSDLDSDNTLSFTIAGQSSVQLSVNNLTHVVSLIAPSDAEGTETINITANDSQGSVVSNPIAIVVNPATATTGTTTVTVTQTRTRTEFRTRFRTISEPKFLELLTPRHLTAFSEDTVAAPIILTNTGESTLNGISLVANASTDIVDVWLGRERYESLIPGQTEQTQLFIRWGGTIDEFDIVLSAASADPQATDRAVISVTGAERVANNRSIVEDTVQFVRDLIQSNPECLELTELLEKTRELIQQGSLDEGKSKLNFIIEGCRYLLSAPREIEQPSPLRQREGDLFKLVSGILLLLLFVAGLIISALLTRKK